MMWDESMYLQVPDSKSHPSKHKIWASENHQLENSVVIGFKGWASLWDGGRRMWKRHSRFAASQQICHVAVYSRLSIVEAQDAGVADSA